MNKLVILLIALVFAVAFVSAEDVRTEGLRSAFNRIKRTVSRAAKTVSNKVNNTINKAAAGVKKVAKKAANGVKKAANKVATGVKKVAKKAAAGVKKVANKIKDKFKPKITTYPRATSLNPLLFAAHLSHASYNSAPYVYNTDPRIYLDDSVAVTTIDTTRNKQRIITKIAANDRLKLIGVGIRGTATKEFSDIMTNLKFLKTKCSLKNAAGQTISCGKVHKGFWADVSQQFEKIRDAIKPFVQKGYSIVVTGHSQGAAESTIVALYLKLQFPSANFFAYNFGSPRVGDKKFASTVEKYLPNLTRFVERSQGLLRNPDPVTVVPPKILGYKHAGKQVNLDCKHKLSLKCHPVVNYIGSVGGVAMPDSVAEKAQQAEAKTAQAAKKKTAKQAKKATKVAKKPTKVAKKATKKATKKAGKRSAKKTKKTTKKVSKKATKKGKKGGKKQRRPGKKGCRKAPKWVKLAADECFVGFSKAK